MKKEWLLVVAVSVITISVALLGVRYFAPQLLGIPIDLQAVQVSEKVPPFFENVFRPEDHNTGEFLLKDPYARVRAKPLLFRTLVVGPHDLLGFRNHSIPNVADIVVIGDSQTYGNNALLEANWPSQMKQQLTSEKTVYAMATGGWGGIQYLDMMSKSSVFRPELVVVAFYSGNDPLETFSLVYDTDSTKWNDFKVNPDTPTNDRPKYVGFPSPPDKNWPVTFSDGLKTIFTPELRLMSNDTGYAVVRESWAIMQKIADNMGRIAQSTGIKLVITMIPTKELVYAERMTRDNLPVDPVYKKLIHFEKENIKGFFQHLETLDHVIPLDIVPGLQTAALDTELLYPSGKDGHPTANGYQVIGKLIASGINSFMTRHEAELKKISMSDGEPDLYFLFRDNRLFLFPSHEFVTANGWNLSDARRILQTEFNKPIVGNIGSVDRQRFGPSPQ